jgi:hypothetical protein
MGLRAIARKNLRGTSVTPPGYRRTFCTVCGAPVPTVDRGIIRVPAGTLNGDPGIRPHATFSSTSKPLGSRSLTPLANLARNQTPVSRGRNPTGGERYQALDLFH